VNQWLINLSPELFSRWAKVVQQALLLVITILFGFGVYFLWGVNSRSSDRIYELATQNAGLVVEVNRQQSDSNRINADLSRGLQSMTMVLDRIATQWEWETRTIPAPRRTPTYNERVTP